MVDLARTREQGTLLVVLGAILLVLGLLGVVGFQCTSGFKSCPQGGCVPTPKCPSTLDYAFSAALLLLGAVMLAGGLVLLGRSKPG